jgi:hypothetical protein
MHLRTISRSPASCCYAQLRHITDAAKRLGDGPPAYHGKERLWTGKIRGSLAALPAWAVGKFTEHQAAVIGAVGVEMLNKRGVCALHLKVIAVAAGISVGTREAIMIAETIGLVTVEHLRGFYDIPLSFARLAAGAS